MVEATGRAGALRADLVAGIALAAFAIPGSMAYAGLAGLPPQAGLYAYLVAGPLFALFTSSRHVAVGPTSSISMMVAAALAPLAGGDPVRYGQLAAATALMVAAISLVAWALQLNQLVNFISEPILIGFKAGVALVIASKQLPKLLGIEAHGSGFFSNVAAMAAHVHEAHLLTALLGLGALALILGLERWLPSGAIVLGVVAASIAASAWFGLAALGVKVAHEVPAGLPWPVLPRFSAHDADELLALAFACFVMGFVETTAVARTFAMKHRYPVAPRREMLALAAANVGTGLFRSYPVSGGMSQSAVNEQGGARSAGSLVAASATIAVVLLFLTGPFRYLPEATLAALVLAAVSGLVERKPFRHLRQVSPIEFRAAFIALLGVLLLGILRGVMLAVVATLLMVISRVSKPAASVRGRRPGTDEFVDLERDPEARAVPGVLVYRVGQPLIYFNVDHVRDDVVERARAAAPRPSLVVLELSLSPRLDLAAVNMLGELEEQLRLLGAQLRLAEVHSAALERLRIEGVADRFGGVGRRAPVVSLVGDDGFRRARGGPLSAPAAGSDRAGRLRWVAFGACVLAGLSNEVSGGALSLALRDAGAELKASTAAMQLVMTLSKLLFGAFMLMGGLLGDTYGRRRVLLFGCGGVVAASVLAGLSANVGQLAVARALDGLANATVGPLTLALVIDLFPAEKAPRAISLFIGLSALGIALGPLTAGSVIQAFGWRAGFAAPALVGALGGLGVWLYAPESRAAERRRLDGVGAVGVAVALLALVFAVVGASSEGWADPRVLQSLMVGAGALVAFIWWERRVADPLLDLSLFRSRVLSAALITGTLIALVIGGAILPLLYFFQNVQGLPPVPALLRIVPMVVVAAACSPLVGAQLGRRGPRPVILAGLVCMAAGCGVLAFLRPETPYPLVLAALVLMGAGNIAVVTPVTEIVLASVPAERSGSAAALNNAAMQVGGALGVATLTSVFFDAARSDYAARLAPTGLSYETIRQVTRAWREALRTSASTGARVLPEGMEHQFEEAFRQAFTVGVARVFAVAALVAGACAVLAWFRMREHATTAVRHVPAAVPEA